MRMCECGSPVFSTDKITRIGYCKAHSYKRTDTDKRSIVQKAISKSKAQPTASLKSKIRTLHSSEENREMVEANKVHKAEMDLFWMNAEKEIAAYPYCSECGEFIPDKKWDFKTSAYIETKEYYRAATAHVLPKRQTFGFPSVASNLDNFLILSASCGCHDFYDRSWEDASQMRIFPLAIEKFKKLYPHIAKSELKNLPEVFRQEIEPK